MVNLIRLLEKTTQQFEKLAMHDHRCLHQRSTKSTCTRCVDHCPSDVLHLNEGIRQTDDCLACGQCVKNCPVSVFEWKYPSYEDIYQRLTQSVDQHEQIILTCSRAPLLLPEANELQLPSFGYLLDEIWAYAETHASIACYLPEGACEGCEVSCTIPDGLTWSTSEELRERLRRNERYDRQKRQSIQMMFRFIKETGMHSANLTPTSLTTGEMKVRWKEYMKTDLERPTATVLETCKDCRACSMLCPESAISLDEAVQDGPRTNVDASKCTACGLCVDVCYFSAIQLI